MSERIDPNEDYYTSNIKHEEGDEGGTKLRSWWGLKMSSTYYYPFKVRFTNRVTNTSAEHKTDALYFTLVKDTENKIKEINLDLKEETLEVWPQLPSTIPPSEMFPASKKLFGVLFLSKEWIDNKQKELDDADIGINLTQLAEGGKWPLVAAGDYSDYEELRARIERLQDADKREQLHASLDKVFNRNPGKQAT